MLQQQQQQLNGSNDPSSHGALTTQGMEIVDSSGFTGCNAAKRTTLIVRNSFEEEGKEVRTVERRDKGDNERDVYVCNLGSSEKKDDDDDAAVDVVDDDDDSCICSPTTKIVERLILEWQQRK
jgi:hypothetical protein